MLVAITVAASPRRLGREIRYHEAASILDLARTIAADLPDVEVIALCGVTRGEAVVFNARDGVGQQDPELFGCA